MKKKRRSIKTGLPPGTPVYTGIVERETEISIIEYDSENYREMKVENIEESFLHKSKSTVSWINVVGLSNTDIIEKIGKNFQIHPLVIEDILNVHQRPKLEDYGDYIFIVLKMITYDDKIHEIESEQVSVILGDNLVLTFQEKKSDVFDPVKIRIKNDKSLIRKMGADYLVYALIDVIVDNYFVVLEKIEEEIEDLEEKVLIEPTPETSQRIHRVKRILIDFRKAIWPLREVLSNIGKIESNLIKSASLYFRDVYDHTIQVIDTLETFKEMVTDLLDVYLSSISNKTNEIMKMLTIIGTIFIPLTFITGIYGMNFRYMPELEWKYGYPTVLVAMFVIGILMVLYFKKKKWL
ncbi:magnesium/cobalt transporter CorA [Thermotoga sp. KOL6]|uniref:magnesium/cobalt transporter CorA n=1 Tax=Thermotoga sp. KOL6 TaxID=126741 RepID=UPI000C77B575|nr:magnesium/cobalt transporter CorA [Thermotoga sp. KOL6]PLV59917.1 magnesium transporter [Thermotoga sp. KOL6]